MLSRGSSLFGIAMQAPVPHSASDEQYFVQTFCEPWQNIPRWQS
jgi:hypothetical protein